MRNHYILIDYENVHIESLEQLPGKKFKVFVFVGSNQTKIPIELAASLQKYGSHVQYIKIVGAGKNALGFHIAFYLGQLSKNDSDAVFYLISKDQGFQPLLLHLTQLGIQITQSDSLKEIVIRYEGAVQSIQEKACSYIETIRDTKMTRPRTVKSLSNSIRSFLRGRVTSPEIDAIIQYLGNAGDIRVENQRVTFPARKAARSAKKPASTANGQPGSPTEVPT